MPSYGSSGRRVAIVAGIRTPFARSGTTLKSLSAIELGTRCVTELIQRSEIDPKLVEQGRRAARGRNIQAMVEADMAFHNAVYAASGNPFVAQSAQLHWMHLRRVMGAVLQHAPQREAIWNEHEAIAKAIAQGDAERAVRLIDHHGRQASENLLARLPGVLHVLDQQATKGASA